MFNKFIQRKDNSERISYTIKLRSYMIHIFPQDILRNKMKLKNMNAGEGEL